MKHNSVVSSRQTSITISYNQLHVSIQVAEGKRGAAKGRNCWGRSNPQVGEPRTPCGMSQIQVPLDTDVNGTLDASVAEHNTGTRTRLLSPTTEPSRARMTVDDSELDGPSDSSTQCSR